MFPWVKSVNKKDTFLMSNLWLILLSFCVFFFFYITNLIYNPRPLELHSWLGSLRPAYLFYCGLGSQWSCQPNMPAVAFIASKFFEHIGVFLPQVWIAVNHLLWYFSFLAGLYVLRGTPVDSIGSKLMTLLFWINPLNISWARNLSSLSCPTFLLFICFACLVFLRRHKWNSFYLFLPLLAFMFVAHRSMMFYVPFMLAAFLYLSGELNRKRLLSRDMCLLCILFAIILVLYVVYFQLFVSTQSFLDYEDGVQRSFLSLGRIPYYYIPGVYSFIFLTALPILRKKEKCLEFKVCLSLTFSSILLLGICYFLKMSMKSEFVSPLLPFFYMSMVFVLPYLPVIFSAVIKAFQFFIVCLLIFQNTAVSKKVDLRILFEVPFALEVAYNLGLGSFGVWGYDLPYCDSVLHWYDDQAGDERLFKKIDQILDDNDDVSVVFYGKDDQFSALSMAYALYRNKPELVSSFSDYLSASRFYVITSIPASMGNVWNRPDADLKLGDDWYSQIEIEDVECTFNMPITKANKRLYFLLRVDKEFVSARLADMQKMGLFKKG